MGESLGPFNTGWPERPLLMEMACVNPVAENFADLVHGAAKAN